MGEVLTRPRQVDAPAAPRLPYVGSVATVALETRADELRDLAAASGPGLRAAELVRLLELAALAGDETPGRANELCADALVPDPSDRSLPAVASVCVYPTLVEACRRRLDGTTVRVAAAAGCTGLPTDVKVAVARRAVELGAHEVDVALDVGAFLSGRHLRAAAEVTALADAVGAARLTVAVDAPALGTYDALRRAVLLVVAAGADAVAVASAPPAAALCALEALRDVHEETGLAVGVKLAPVASPEAAALALVLVRETLGPRWLAAERCRIPTALPPGDLLR